MSVHPSILLEHLGLPHAAAVTQTWLDRAAQEGLSYADFLEGLLEEELVARTTAETERRLRQAGSRMQPASSSSTSASAPTSSARSSCATWTPASSSRPATWS